MKKIEINEAEIILARVIDELYLEYKNDFCDYKNKTHKLGQFKEMIKCEFAMEMKRAMGLTVTR